MLLSPIVCEPLDVIGRCYLPCGCIMADDFAIVADGIATFLVLLWQMEKPHYEVIDNVLTVADGKSTM